MRKIEKAMLEAVNSKQDFRLDNTTVYFISQSESGNPHGSRSEIRLHGNHIADYWHDSGELEVNVRTLRRWPTMTTRSRLRALGAKLESKKGDLYLNGTPISDL